MKSVTMFGPALLWLPLCAGACIPYTVATTATPVPVGEVRSSTVMYATPLVDSRRNETPSRWRPGMDYDMRFGLSDRSDIAIRIPSFSGIVVNYKRLLSDSGSGTLVAIMPGAGFVNLLEHAMGELTLIVSARERVPDIGMRGRLPFRVYPYGGLRVMQVLPLHRDAVHDLPTAGGFFGLHIFDGTLGVSPEVGIFYDNSALDLRRSDLVIVPAISVQFDDLPQRIRRWPRPDPRPPRRPPIPLPRPRG